MDKNTTVKEVLLKHKDDVCYIATEHGSSWLGIDAGSIWIKKEFAANMNLRSKLLLGIDRTEKALANYPMSFEDIDIEIANCKNHLAVSPTKSWSDRLKHLNSYRFNKKRLETKLSKLCESLDNYIPFWDRKVREIYPAEYVCDTHPAGICIIIEGVETGNVWFTSDRGSILE